MGRLVRFWSLTRREKQFFCEAGFLLLLSNLCVKMIAFRHIYNFLRAHSSSRTLSAFDRADDIDLVDLSLSRAANLLPSKSLCLSRSIAAFIMLRRRGIPAVIFAGVHLSGDSSLLAHAWIQIGCEAGNSKNSEFTQLVRIGQEPVDH